jgi:glutathione synthase/RimK-type ligase-like ATP-grasp enzyme
MLKMISKIRVYPYKQGSKSAKVLAEALGGKVLKHVGSKFKPRAGDVVINWGSSNMPAFGQATTLNPDVEAAQCKLATFDTLRFEHVSIPPHCEAKANAKKLGFPVVCRTKLRGHSGEGIVIANNEEELVDAPLYTKYVKKKDEYRVHVLRDKAFFIQRKARKLDVENPDWKVRNLAGGFVFAEAAEEDVPKEVIQQAELAIAALNIDFGGVDVIWNDKEQRAYVLEVNTACGLEDRTAEKYRQAIIRLVENN